MTEAERKQLYGATQEFLRRRRNLNVRTAGAVMGNALTRSDAGSSKWLPQADTSKLAPAETEDYKAKIRDQLLKMKKLDNDRESPLADIYKEKIKAKKELYSLLGKVTGDDVKARADVLIAREANKTAVFKQARDLLDREHARMYGDGGGETVLGVNMKAMNDAIDQAGTAAGTYDMSGETGPLDTNVASTVARGWSSAPPSEQPKLAENFIKRQLQWGKSLDVVDAQLTMLENTAATPEERAMAQGIRAEIKARGPRLEGEMNALREGMAVESEEFTQQLIGGISTKSPEVAERLKKALTILGAGADTLDPAEAVKQFDEILDASTLDDPQMRDKLMGALDKLDQDNPQDQTIRAARDEFFQSPLMLKYMEETGIQDPQVAMRQLKSELQQDKRSVRLQSMQERRKRRQAIRAGKAVPASPAKTSPQTPAQAVTSVAMTSTRDAFDNLFGRKKLNGRAKAIAAHRYQGTEGAEDNVEDKEDE